MEKVRRALISIFDKTGSVEFVAGLRKLGIEIFSTGGTAKLLRDAGIQLKDVSEVTGFPEILDGRVKTLHPKIHAGILAVRSEKKHMDKLNELDIETIDMVVVNLYPFESVLKKGAAHEEIIENIDIGGPAMIRAAAKNYKDIVVVVNPSDYSIILKEMRENNGCLDEKTLLSLAQKAFEYTSSYDSIINLYFLGVLKKTDFPENLTIPLRKVKDLRYGENPHQKAALYEDRMRRRPNIVNTAPLQGKELSYNNILDAEAAVTLIKEFDQSVAVIVKHNNPCGVATGKDILDAYNKALSIDPVSAFGGILSCNRAIDGKAAEIINQLFLEVIIASDFTEDALKIFSKKKNLRLLQLPLNYSTPPYSFRSVDGGAVVQQTDILNADEIKNIKVVTKRKPADDEMEAMIFAWKVAKHVKSNAIVFAKGGMAIGIGAGQTSRVDSVKVAIMKTKFPLAGSVVASDAFFPFRDGIDEIAKTGATAVIQPGGSVRDEEIINAANEHNLAMLFTEVRHFRH